MYISSLNNIGFFHFIVFKASGGYKFLNFGLRSFIFFSKRCYKSITTNYFCVCHKNRRKHNQHFELLFFMINLHFKTSDNLHRAKQFHFFNHNIHLALASLEIQRTLIQAKYSESFFYPV